jgi:hypothetical protein
MNRAILLVVVAACAHNVNQDKATSEDGKPKGAVAVPLVNNQATVTGIVTYPGGDRVDWKMLELPAKLKGELGVKLTWSTPRPNLQLAFDVFDANNKKLVTSNSSARRRRGPRAETVKEASGKYFIRVYAVGRGDAGRYRLDITFKEVDYSTEPDWAKVSVPPPPRLATLPTAPTVWGPCPPHDLANPNCADKCWADAPPTHPGCKKICRTPGNPADPNCAKEMTCDLRAPDRRIPDCKGKFGPCKDPANPDQNNPNCDDVTLPAKRLRITTVQVSGDQNVLVVPVKAGSGITTAWTAEVLQGGDTNGPPATDDVLRSGTLKIVRVDDDNIVLSVSVRSVTKQQLDTNKWVLFRPPPKLKKP